MERRSVRLRVLDTHVNLRPGLPPGGRSECRDGPRPCPYIRCSMHLWLTEGRDSAGCRVNGKPPRSKLREGLIEELASGHKPPSCALDVAARVASGKLLVTQQAAVLGIRQSQFRAILASALAKLRAAGVEIRERLAIE